MSQLVVRPVRPYEEARWGTLMARHHYLGFRQLVGESLKYVAESEAGWLALVGWASAAFKCGPRDRWIGWCPEQQWRRLRYVANNSRFLVLPEARRPNLASQVLAANHRRLADDWERIFGHPVVLAETFVDARFAGTCYRAAGWQLLGSSRGYGRNGGRYYFHGAKRTIWVKPLHRRGREWLAAPFDVPAFQPQGKPTVDVNTIVDAHGELLELLASIPDGRKKRGIRHQQASVVAIAMCAVLSGARSLVAMGEWAQALPQTALERLRCRLHPIHRTYIAPSEPTIRRTLQQIDVVAVDRALGDWLSSKGVGDAIAVDGKTLRGSTDGDGETTHLLSAIMHKEGLVIAQRQVPNKTNEITGFQPLLAPLDLAGKVVTADAMHTQREHARFLVEEKHADYLFIAKGNQPKLEEDLNAIDPGLFSPSPHHLGKGPWADREAHGSNMQPAGDQRVSELPACAASPSD